MAPLHSGLKLLRWLEKLYVLKSSREEGSPLKPCTIATSTNEKKQRLKAPLQDWKSVYAFAFLWNEQVQNSVCSVRRLKAEGKEEEISETSTTHFLKLWSHVWLCLQGNASAFPVFSAHFRTLNREWKWQHEWGHTLRLGKTFVPRLSCPWWDHLTCMGVLVEEMALLAFLKNTAFGTVDFSNFTKSLPTFAFFFFNGSRAALLSWEGGKGKNASVESTVVN